MTTPTLCPACAGLSEPEHPGGLLAGWHHAQACELLASEDARAVADHDRLDSRTRFVRDSTETERTLLAELGHTWTAEPLATYVESRKHHPRRAVPRMARHHRGDDDMTDTTSTPEALDSPAGETRVSPAGTPAEPPKPDDDGNPNAEAARYRTRLRETEAERDSIAGRLTGYQRAEAERLAAAGLSKGSDLWLDGLDVGELLDDDGNIDPDKVTVQVAAVLDGRPGLAAVAPPRMKPDRSQASQSSAAMDSGWSAVLKGGRR